MNPYKMEMVIFIFFYVFFVYLCAILGASFTKVTLKKPNSHLIIIILLEETTFEIETVKITTPPSWLVIKEILNPCPLCIL